MVAALASALFSHRRIETTLAKAKALRPFAERLITLAKKASLSNEVSEKLHYRRQAAAQLRNPGALQTLFDERVSEFLNRSGGYTRIYKLVNRGTDAAPMALIELIPASDEGYKKSKRGKGAAKGKAKKTAKAPPRPKPRPKPRLPPPPTRPKPNLAFAAAPLRATTSATGGGANFGTPPAAF